jgi:6,7-dimethyl-8-ribityllumazine synthase
MSRSPPSVSPVAGGRFSVAVAASCYNPRLVEALVSQTAAALRSAGVKAGRLHLVRVPGANELPSAVQILAKRRRPDVIIALGVVIRGATLHYELIANGVTHALQRVALDEGIPVINGVIMAENTAQASARCLGSLARGAEFARAALVMAALRKTRK